MKIRPGMDILEKVGQVIKSYNDDSNWTDVDELERKENKYLCFFYFIILSHVLSK